MVRRFVRSRNLVNEKVLAHSEPVVQKKKLYNELDVCSRSGDYATDWTVRVSYPSRDNLFFSLAHWELSRKTKNYTMS